MCPLQVLHEQACTHMLSLIVSNLWEFDTALAGDGEREGGRRSSTNVLLPSAIEDFELPARLTDIVELLKASPSAKHHVRIESALDPTIPTLRGERLQATAHYLLLTAHYLLLTTHYSLLTTYYLPLTTHY